MIQKYGAALRTALSSGVSSHKLTMSFCVGLYIAASPFIGLHFVMIVAVVWLFGLNFPVTFVTASLNNPWTMIPYYSAGYFLGYAILHHVLGLNPSWIISLEKVFGSGYICVWSFLLGGNVLGVLCALIGYPIAKFVFGRFAERAALHHAVSKLK